MKLKLTLQRPSGPDADILITTDASATVGDVAMAIASVDPSRPSSRQAPQSAATLRVIGEGIIEPDIALGDSIIRPGAVVAVVPAGTVTPAPPRGVPTIRLDVVEGPDAGSSFSLPIGTHHLGRNALQTNVTLTDPAVSSRHARLDVSSSAVRFVDLNSAHGLEVDGGLVARVELTDGGSVLVGDSLVRVTALLPPEKAAELASGTIRFNRPPRIEARYAGTQLAGPAAVLGDDDGAFEAALADWAASVDDELARERSARRKENPSSEEVYSQALELGTVLWSRRPEQEGFLSLNLGYGALPSRSQVVSELAAGLTPARRARIQQAIDERLILDDIPVVESLLESGAIGIAGPQKASADVARSLLVQATGLHSPAELVIAAIVSAAWTPEFEYLKWLPHVESLHSPIDGAQLANTAATAEALLAAIEELVELRSASHESVPAVLLLVSVDAPADYARLVRLAERGPAAGVFTLWVGSSVAELPAVARTFIELATVSDSAQVGFVRQDLVLSGVRTEGVSRENALNLARHLTQVVDASAVVVDSTDLPPSVSLLSLIGDEAAESAEFIVNRWLLNDSVNGRVGEARSVRAGRLRAVVGQAGVDPLQLDLRTQGPHALIAGATGSGKSEFLQSWVLSLAAEYGPDRVNFLFIDYKGGAAFADCVALPHTVGLITDLSPSLMQRTLPSLRAELRYREHLINRHKARDLATLERLGIADAPPSLIIVVDEFAAIAKDAPEFIDGLLEIAQRGSPAGLHLILATQRPDGALIDSVRASMNLRIALRTADDLGSFSVIGDSTAARFDPGLPGRAIAKTSMGRAIQFQSAYSGGYSSRIASGPAVRVAELRFGAELLWQAPPALADMNETGRTDGQRMVTTITAAAEAASIPIPRRAVLPALEDVYDLTRLRLDRTDADLVIGVSDDVEQQRQSMVVFRPDQQGHIGIFGVGGTGKSATLRTIAATAAITPNGGPVDVYAIDFAGGGLRMLDVLPNVGSVLGDDDLDRVVRLLRMLKHEADSRSERYSAVLASSITEYRRIADEPDERRILVFIDGFSSFREKFEMSPSTSRWYSVFQDLMSFGRQVGIHFALTANRQLAVPSQIMSTLGLEILLRTQDGTDYYGLNEAGILLGPDAPPGRGIVNGLESQIAILGGDSNVAVQARSLTLLGEAVTQTGRAPAAPIGWLPTDIPPKDVAADKGGDPILGISDDDLEPIGYNPSGLFLLGGPPGSGRSTALRWMVESVRRAAPSRHTYYLGNARSDVPSTGDWAGIARSPKAALELATLLNKKIADDAEIAQLAIFVEDLVSFENGVAEAELGSLIQRVRQSPHLLVAESETAAWSRSYILGRDIKTYRRGMLLQAESSEIDSVLRTHSARIGVPDTVRGRGYYVADGKVTRVQLPHA